MSARREGIIVDLRFVAGQYRYGHTGVGLEGQFKAAIAEALAELLDDSPRVSSEENTQ